MNDTPATAETPPAPVDRARLRRVSGRVAAAWLVISLVLTAILIPMTVRLPRWIDFEIVLGVWWVMWFGVLTAFLYRGLRVADDHTLHRPRSWFSSNKSQQQTTSNDSWWDGFFWGWAIGDELAFLIVALVLLVGGIWLLFEVAIPVLLFLLYFVARGMLAGVVNDRRGCRGHLGRSVLWGFVWATAYTLPLAGAVWFIHFVHQRGHAGT